jgi:hypothetical protein
LIDHFGQRDFYRHFSKKEILKMNQDEKFEKLCEFMNKWAYEIDEYRIENLEIKRDDRAD